MSREPPCRSGPVHAVGMDARDQVVSCSYAIRPGRGSATQRDIAGGNERVRDEQHFKSTYLLLSFRRRSTSRPPKTRPDEVGSGQDWAYRYVGARGKREDAATNDWSALPCRACTYLCIKEGKIR